MSQSQCECLHDIADRTLDDDLKALLVESWYRATNNMDATEALPRRGRVVRQMKTVKKAAEETCHLS